MCLISSAGNSFRPATNLTARSRSAGAAPQRPSSAPQTTRPRRQGRDLPKRLPLKDAGGMMTTLNRREFLETSAGVIAAGMSPPLLTQSKKPLRLGLIIGIGNEPEAAIAKVHDLGLPTCQVYVDRKSTRLNSSHSQISYAVFCLKKKKKEDMHSVRWACQLIHSLSSTASEIILQQFS